jgi:hypothetical protein
MAEAGRAHKRGVIAEQGVRGRAKRTPDDEGAFGAAFDRLPP